MAQSARTARFYMVSSWPTTAKTDKGEYSCVKDKAGGEERNGEVMNEVNKQLSEWLDRISKEVKVGRPAETLTQGMTGILTALCIIARERDALDVQDILGALEMAKAHTVHEWHAVITQSEAENGGTR